VGPNPAWDAKVAGERLLLAKANELSELWIVLMPKRVKPNLPLIVRGKPHSTEDPASNLTDDLKSGTQAGRQIVILDEHSVETRQ
jgi:hypothetical protein